MDMMMQERTGRTKRRKANLTGTMFVLGVRLDNIDRETALGLVKGFAGHRDGLPARTVFFTNVHSICTARRNRGLMRCINLADLVLPDGSGLKIAGRILGEPIRENLNGTDFTPLVLESAVELGRTVYLLGARPDAVAACRDRLLRDHPRLKIVGFHHGYFAPGEEEAVVAHINACRPDILLVGFGTPLQEEWISRNARRLDAGVCMAVGGLFDFLSGTFARAPVWMRRAGIEWLFRFLKDPAAKWNRVFLEIPLFLTLVVARRIVPRQIRTLYARRMGFR